MKSKNVSIRCPKDEDPAIFWHEQWFRLANSPKKIKRRGIEIEPDDLERYLNIAIILSRKLVTRDKNGNFTSSVNMDLEREEFFGFVVSLVRRYVGNFGLALHPIVGESVSWYSVYEIVE